MSAKDWIEVLRRKVGLCRKPVIVSDGPPAQVSDQWAFLVPAPLTMRTAMKAALRAITRPSNPVQVRQKPTSGGDLGLEQSQSQNATCWDYATFCIRWRTVAYANLPVMPGRAPSFTFAALIKDRRPPGG